MEVNKRRSIALMAQRRVEIAAVEHLTKGFVADTKWRHMDATKEVDCPSDIFNQHGVSMHLNPLVVDWDVDGPPMWQKAFELAVRKLVGDAAFKHAFKRKSLGSPTHYLFSSDISENITNTLDVLRNFRIQGYQPQDNATYYGKSVSLDIRTTIGNPDNDKLHTVLPGSVYYVKNAETGLEGGDDVPRETEMLVWSHSTDDVRMAECPDAVTIRRIMFLTLTLYSFGYFLDESVALSDEKTGRHSFYLTLFGWMRRLYTNYSDELCFNSSDDLRSFCYQVAEAMCEWTGDDEESDRKNIVKSTFRASVDKLSGNPAFIDTFKSMHGNVAKLMNDMAVTLGAPARPPELEILLASTAMDISSGKDLTFVQLGANNIWNQPKKVVREMNKFRLEALYNSYKMKMQIGGKIKHVDISRVFQNSPEMKIVVSRRFSTLSPHGEMTVIGVDDVSKRQLVTMNTFMGHPFSKNHVNYNPRNSIIKWFENSAKLLTQTEDEARWLIARIASVFKNPDIHYRTIPVLIGEESTGKSKFIDVIATVIGSPYVHQLGTKDLIQADSFTGFVENKIMVFATEIDLSEMTTQDRIKSWSADRTIDIQAKGKEARTIENPIRLIMMATNKEQVQALNKQSTSEDTRLALFKAKSKDVAVELRKETIKLYGEVEKAMVAADVGKKHTAEHMFSTLATYFHKLDSPFMLNTYSTLDLSKPVETAERRKLRVTQIPSDFKTVIEILNEPSIVQLQVGAFNGVGPLVKPNKLKGCIWIERSKFISMFNQINNDKRRSGRFISFFNSTNGYFGKVGVQLCKYYTGEEVTVKSYKNLKQDNKKYYVVKLPPYMAIHDYMVSMYGDLASDLFPYTSNCNDEGYLSEELSDNEIGASLGMLPSSF